MRSMYCGMSSLRSSAGGRIPAGSIMTNERARNRQQGVIEPVPVGAADEEVLRVREVRHGPDPAAGWVVDADPGADVARPRHGDRADVAALCEQRLDLVRPVEALVRERDEQPRCPGALDQVGQGRKGLPPQV